MTFVNDYGWNTKAKLPKSIQSELENMISGIPSLIDTPQGDILERNFVNLLSLYQSKGFGISEFWKAYEKLIGHPWARYLIVEPRTRGFGTLIPKDEQKVLDDMLKEVQTLRDTPDGDDIEMKFLRKLLDYQGRFFDTKKFWKEYRETIGDSTNRMNEILDREHTRSGDTRPRFWWVPPPADP